MVARNPLSHGGRQIVSVLRGIVWSSSMVPFLKRSSHTAASSLSSVCFGRELTRGRSVPTHCSPVATLVRSTVKSSWCLSVTAPEILQDTSFHRRCCGPLRCRVEAGKAEALSPFSRAGCSPILITSFCRCVFFRLMSPLGDSKSECW